MRSFGLSCTLLGCVASAVKAAPSASAASTVKVNTAGSNGTTSNGTGSLSASGTLAPFGDIGVGCGINWAEGTSFGGKSLSAINIPRRAPPVPHLLRGLYFSYMHGGHGRSRELNPILAQKAWTWLTNHFGQRWTPGRIPRFRARRRLHHLHQQHDHRPRHGERQDQDQGRPGHDARLRWRRRVQDYVLGQDDLSGGDGCVRGYCVYLQERLGVGIPYDILLKASAILESGLFGLIGHFEGEEKREAM